MFLLARNFAKKNLRALLAQNLKKKQTNTFPSFFLLLLFIARPLMFVRVGGTRTYFFFANVFSGNTLDFPAFENLA